MTKAQTAMEYLITYSWAIIILIGVLGGLYALGVFNSNSYSGKLTPGSCQIYRPYGAYSTQLINTQGVCNSGLPQSLPFFSGNAFVGVPPTPIISFNGVNYISITAWVNPSAYMADPDFSTIVAKTSSYYLMINPAGNLVVSLPGSSSPGYHYSITSLPLNRWSFVALTYNGVQATIYINGVQDTSFSDTGSVGTPSSTYYIGFGANLDTNGNLYGANPRRFNGELANIQLYNSSLSANNLKSLYIQGIGSPPINLQSLLGWWPLNGNLNDYSGNGNSGSSNTVYFAMSWQNGYQTP